MKIKDIINEDFINYKQPSMTIMFPTCSFKCDLECGKPVCQNSALASAPTIEISTESLINRYLSNPITSSVVCQGLEPFDSWEELYDFISQFRQRSNDDIVIYTGYTEYEIPEEIEALQEFPNVIVKFGRFIPNQLPHHDGILGVKLASDNQYARRLKCTTLQQ